MLNYAGLIVSADQWDYQYFGRAVHHERGLLHYTKTWALIKTVVE